VPHRFRPTLLRLAGASIGSPVFLRAGLRLNGRASRLTLHGDVFINRDCYIDATARVEIASGVRIGDHVRLLTSTHEISGPTRRAGRAQSESLTIGAGAWIGSSVTILPGASVASGCVIAAGSVVTSPTEPDGLYAGVPAERRRSLDEARPHS